MTCRELRLCFEEGLRAEATFGEEAEHLAHCAECARFVESRRELGSGLRLLRESVPQPSESLDAAVLANYRQQIAVHRSEVKSVPSYRAVAIVCGGLAAVLLLTAALVFRQGRRTEAFVPPPHPVQPQVAVTQSVTQSPTPNKTTSVPVSHAAVPAPSARNGNERSSRSLAAVTKRPVAARPALPEFQSLMYCDELSCGGAMQVVRVQLPPSAAAIAPAMGSPSGIVYADVLVGADGIARAIRIEE